ncbi:MAG: DHA2 family efflux MFS transporter permease subunit [Gammaproteobacteria bacterium]
MKKNIILFIVSFAMFMEAVDTTIINTAIPTMAHSLKVSPIDLKLALISYLLSLAIFIPISGWMADKYGAKKVFIIAIGIFTLSSFWCGLTQNLYELVIARIVQGLGGSMTLPVGRLIIIRTCERHELVSKMSIVVIVAALGMMLGPLLGGLITSHFSWRWIFWVNIPVGILTATMAAFLLPHMAAKTVKPLDKLGFVYFGSGLAALTFGLSSISESGIQNSFSLAIIGIAIFLLILYFYHSHRKTNPIVKTDLLRIRTFRISFLGNLLARFGFGGIPFLIPLLLQLGLGYSPELSGLLLAPTALGVLLVKPFSLGILRLLGYKKLLILNTILVAASLLSFSDIGIHTSPYHIAFLTFLFGFLISLQYSGMNSLAYADISHENLSAATSIMSTIQQLAQSFGVAIAAILVRFYSSGTENTILATTTFHRTFITMGVITLFSTLIFIHLKKDDGKVLLTPVTPSVPATSI